MTLVINNLEKFLVKIIPENKKYVRHETRKLNSAGDNYASFILAIDIIVKNEEDDEEEFQLIGKILPPAEFNKAFQNVEKIVPNEFRFYEKILPTLQNFEYEETLNRTLNFFPKYFGSRYNLEATQILDQDALLLLENLTAQGFILKDKFTGFKLQEAHTILSKMARLHGVVMAMEANQPETFQEEILPLYQEFKTFQVNNEHFFATEMVVNQYLSVLQEDELCSLHFLSIKDMLEVCAKNANLPKNHESFRHNHFNSLVHNDLWTNNIMVKFQMGQMKQVKFLDFQLYEYTSVVKDVLFFICTSVEENVFNENFNDLIKFYYESLISTLKDFQCDITSLSYELFLDETKRVVGQISYLEVIKSMAAILPVENNVFEVDEFDEKALLGQLKISEECKKRMHLTTKKFIQNGWI